MLRSDVWADVAGFLGFAAFNVLFFIALDNRGGRDRFTAVVFSLMAAIPVAAVAALFAALRTIIEELHDVRREVQRLQHIEELASVAADRSVQFKANPHDRDPR